MPYNRGQDPHYYGSKQADAPARSTAAVTPNDNVDLVKYAKRLWIGGAGNITVIPTENDDAAPVTFAVPVGIFNAVQVRRILATGTAATGIIALA